MIYCENVVKYCGRSIFFLIPLQISTTIIFFPPIFGNDIATIATNFFSPFRQWHCHNWFSVSRFEQQEFR